MSNAVREGRDWREPGGLVWTVQETGPVKTTLARWVLGEDVDEPDQVVKLVTTETLINGDGGWKPLSEYEAEEARSRAVHAAASPLDDLTLEAEPAFDASDSADAEEDLRRESAEARELPSVPHGSPAGLSTELRMLRRDVTENAAGVLSNLLRLLARAESAAEHLHEVLGPRFTAWRCDECGTLVTDDQMAAWWKAYRVDPISDRALDMSKAWLVLGVHPIYKTTEQDEPNYVECLRVHAGRGGEQLSTVTHGPMRHVVALVTSDSPSGAA